MRRRRTAAALLGCALLLLGAALAPPIGADDAATEARKLQALRERIGEVRKSLEQARGRKGDVERQLAATESEIARVSTALKRTEGENRKLRRQLQALEHKRATYEMHIAAQRSRLASQVRAAFLMGRQEQLKILLNQEDPALLGRALTYYDYFNRARLEAISGIEGQLAALREVRAQISSAQGELDAVRMRQGEQMAALQRTREARSKLLATIDGQISDAGQQLQRLQRDEADLQQLVQRLQQALSEFAPADIAGRPFSELKGRLPWPTRGALVARFGQPREVGKLAWRGVLIGAPAGAEVRTVSRGRVVFADWLRGFGLIVIVDHGHGYMSLYGRNQSLARHVGERVAAGDVIATVGDSGGNEQAGLYFEIRHDGQPVDPAQWCRSPVTARKSSS